MIVPAQRNALTRFSDEKWSGLTPAYAQAMGIAVRRPGRKRLIDEDELLVVLHAMDDSVAMARHPWIAIEPVDASAQQVEPELIARRAAERARDEHACPVQPAGRHRHAHRDVVDLALENGEEEDGEIDQHAT